MSAELFQALDAVARRVMAIAAQDPELRSCLSALAQAILSATVESPSCPEVQQPAEQLEKAPDKATPSPIPAPAPVETVKPRSPAAVAPLEDASRSEPHSPAAVPLARAALPVQEAAPRERLFPTISPSDKDLPLIEARCRLKAEGVRWAVTRRRRLAEGADFRTEIEPQDRDVIARAKELPDCFLWMNNPSGPSPANPSLLEDVARCFDAVADAIALARLAADMDNNRSVFARILELTAEAQSALRSAVLRIDGSNDRDQLQVFAWLKSTAAEQQVLIPRFMRADDVADSSGWSGLAARIDALGEQLEQTRERARQRKKLLGSLRYKVQKIADEKDGGQEERWHEIAAVVDQLVQAGTPPSNLDVRQLLLSVLDDMPELAETPAGFRLVLREIDHFLASRPPSPNVVPARPSEEVKQAAGLLEGKSVVLIGGDSRPDAAESLKSSFALKELYWIATREHQPLEGFEAYVARPDVAVVLLAVRWSSHSYGEVKQFCDRYGKMLVRLPGGYHPNQVAYQILSQCGDRLVSAS